MKNSSSKDFNFVVAHKYEGGGLGTYSVFGEVKRGSLKYARDFLKYVKIQSPDKSWKIYKINERGFE